MTLALSKRSRRPWWMTTFGHEPLGDVFYDRLWPEWRRDAGEEVTPSVDFSEKDGKYYLTAELPGINKNTAFPCFNEEGLNPAVPGPPVDTQGTHPFDPGIKSLDDFNDLTGFQRQVPPSVGGLLAISTENTLLPWLSHTPHLEGRGCVPPARRVKKGLDQVPTLVQDLSAGLFNGVPGPFVL